MSRTYRCRHLPKHGANKVVDGGFRFCNRWNKAKAETEKLLGPRPTKTRALIKAGFHNEYVKLPEPPHWSHNPKSLFYQGDWDKMWFSSKSVQVPGSYRPTEAVFQWD